MNRALRAVILITAFVAITGVVWFSARVVADQRFATSLASAQVEARAGRFEVASGILSALPTRQLFANDEATELLGVCQHAAGRFDEALATWARIPLTSPRSGSVALARARTLVGNFGRYAEAEAILEAALPTAAPASVRLDIRHTLWQLDFYEFRTEAMRRLIRDGRRDWRDPGSELRDLWMIDDATVMLDSVRATIDSAAALAPDDDRVWLAQAGLDRLEGRFGQAARRLEDCSRRRPDDTAVWRARLDVARVADRIDDVIEAMNHLPVDALADFERIDLRVWIAAKLGKVEDERQALEERLTVEPAEPATLERLAVLAWKAGQAERSVELRRQKTLLDNAKDRYRRLLKDTVPQDSVRELAELAETLHRSFEARGWWSLVARSSPGDPEAMAASTRLDRAWSQASTPKTGRLVDQFAGLIPKRDPSLAAPGRSGASQVKFRDIAESSGLKFTFLNGKSPQRQLPETTAGGVGLLDFNGDGLLDVYLVQGGRFPQLLDSPGGDRLFRNKGDGTFEDVTTVSGIASLVKGYGHGVTVGDFDNDGRPDLFLTRWRAYILLRNKGDGTFEDVTNRAGLSGDRDWPTSAAFADLDNDGDLDLYVCHYLDWDADHPTLCPRTFKPGEAVDPDRRNEYCMPHPFPARPDHLFRNDKGSFVDVTTEAGIVDRDGRGLGVIAADLDGDGKTDLFVANDTTANYLFHNLGGMKFEEVGLSMGVACNADGAYQAGMGTALGDLDGDGLPDLIVTNFYGESTSFFRNLGQGMFGVESAAVGLAAPSKFLLGFGVSFLDVNNDGRLDLAQANGHVIDDRPNFPLEMPAMLLTSNAEGRFVDVSRTSGDVWMTPRLGRGLAVGDLDNDGRSDVVLLSQNSPLAVLKNETTGGKSLTIQLEGTASNRDGVGAVVSVTVGKRTLKGWRFGGGSFQSASDPRLHFGLGDAAKADRVEVSWPSGKVDRFEQIEAGFHRLIEGKPAR